MNNLVFYRKYRPSKFEELVGQEHIIKILKNAVEKNRVAHAYLFSGPRGTGKTSVARILAKVVGCEAEDVIEIDAASSRGIDEARALREAVRFLPLRSPKKIYIIDEVHMLTKEAFNALLKTLEEPPEHAVFVLATTEFSKVPETIVSRTQHFEFHKISIPDIVQELKKITRLEKFEADDDALKLIAFFADGSLRDAENTLYQVESAREGKKVTEMDVRLLLGVPEEELINRVLELFAKRETAEMLNVFDELMKSGANPETVGRLLLRSVRAIYLLSLDQKNERLLTQEFSIDEVRYFQKLIPLAQPQKNQKPPEVFWEYALNTILDALRTSTSDALALFPLELALIKIATFDSK